jgi:hypothetical protein
MGKRRLVKVTGSGLITLGLLRQTFTSVPASFLFVPGRGFFRFPLANFAQKPNNLTQEKKKHDENAEATTEDFEDKKGERKQRQFTGQQTKPRIFSLRYKIYFIKI